MAENENHPISKSELLKLIQKERTTLDDLISGLPNEKKLEAGVEAHWSVKDIMAHIASWERLAQDRINAALTGEPLKFEIIEGDDFVDQLNADIFEKNKNTLLEKVEKEFRESFDEFWNQISNLDEDFLKTPLPFDWAGDLTAQVLISANTHWHYQEHADSIRKWLGKS